VIHNLLAPPGAPPWLMLMESMSTIKETMDSVPVMLPVTWQLPKLDPELSTLEDKILHNNYKQEGIIE